MKWLFPDGQSNLIYLNASAGQSAKLQNGVLIDIFRRLNHVVKA